MTAKGRVKTPLRSNLKLTTMKTMNLQAAINRCGLRRNFLNLAGAPNDEEAIRAGGDRTLATLECQTLMEQLIREHGEAPDGAEFFIMENHHDFGIYYDLSIFYVEPDDVDDGETTPSLEYALKCESIPDRWDNEAIASLVKAGHPKYAELKEEEQKSNVMSVNARWRADFARELTKQRHGGESYAWGD